MSEPVKSPFLTFIKELVPVLVAQLTLAITTNLGGFQVFIVRSILKYGGRALMSALNEAIFQHDRKVEQDAAEKEYMAVVNDPTATEQQRGEAYSRYFNSGRHPKP